MRRSRQLSGIFLIFLLLLSAAPASAEVVVFQREYVYDASEADSKLACRTISLVEVKRLLLEELGTYIESRTRVRDFALTSDEIRSFSAGIVKTEIIDENWDGKVYRMTARIAADPDEVAETLKRVAGDDEYAARIAAMEEKNRESLDRIRELAQNLEETQSNLFAITADYEAAKKIVSFVDLMEQATSLRREKRFSEALELVDRAVSLNPIPHAFITRGRILMGMENFRKAIADFDRVLASDPENAAAVYYKGIALNRRGNRREGVRLIKKAAAMGKKEAKLWLKAKNR